MVAEGSGPIIGETPIPAGRRQAVQSALTDICTAVAADTIGIQHAELGRDTSDEAIRGECERFVRVVLRQEGASIENLSWEQLRGLLDRFSAIGLERGLQPDAVEAWRAPLDRLLAEALGD